MRLPNTIQVKLKNTSNASIFIDKIEGIESINNNSCIIRTFSNAWKVEQPKEIVEANIKKQLTL